MRRAQSPDATAGDSSIRCDPAWGGPASLTPREAYGRVRRRDQRKSEPTLGRDAG